MRAVPVRLARKLELDKQTSRRGARSAAAVFWYLTDVQADPYFGFDRYSRSNLWSLVGEEPTRRTGSKTTR
jgi:hypothetical protein